jgi:hypothetical protein
VVQKGKNTQLQTQHNTEREQAAEQNVFTQSFHAVKVVKPVVFTRGNKITLNRIPWIIPTNENRV